MIRPLERQFEPDTVERIRALQRSLQSLPFEGRPARYLVSEIVRCLEAGLLLAALQVALSLLELFFRDLLISTRFHQVSDGSDTLVGPWRKLDQISEDIEDGSRLDFYSILDELVESAVVDQEDAGEIKELYRLVRIPIHHAITRRLITRSELRRYGSVGLAVLGLPPKVTLHEIDETIELDALGHLESALHFMSRHCEEEGETPNSGSP